MTPRIQHTALAAALLALTGLATACGGEADIGPSADPQSYYDNYQEGDQDAAGAATSQGGAAGPAAADGQEPGLLEDNTFVDAGMSGYVDPTVDPESTFALDVDNGSFRVAQALAADGIRPPAESVRSEEWVNALPYDDPAPTETDLALRTETALAPSLDDGTQEVRVAVTARELAAEDRPSVNLTLVVDRSGSMDIRSRLGLVKSSIALLAESLRPDDTVSVVAFDDVVDVVLPPTRIDDNDAILAAVDRLHPGGSTNLAEGLARGYEQARSAYRPGGINVVILCSDGVANVGITGPDGIVSMIAEQGRNGIHLVTVGYGMGNYNDHLMEQLADQGDGFYRYVDTYEEAEHVYVDELTSLLTPVADDARTQVDVRPGARHVVPPGRLRQPGDGRRVVRGPRRRRRRARGRPPGHRALRGAAGRRRRARHPDRDREGPVGLRRHPGAGQRRGAGAGGRSRGHAERLLRPGHRGRRPRRAGQAERVRR